MTGMERIQNWRRWAVGGSHKLILKHYFNTSASVCGQYRRSATEMEDDEAIVPIDELDAIAVEKELHAMPAQLCHAVIYFCTGRMPANCIYKLNRMPEEQLMELVHQAARRL